MHKWVCAVLVGVALAGCSGDIEEPMDELVQESPVAGDTNATLPALAVDVLFADANHTFAPSLNVTLGSPLNFTLQSAANATVSWTAVLMPVSANATLNDTVQASGVGLPANVSLVPVLTGNHTLDLTFTAEGYADSTLSYAVVVLDAGPAFVDPCAGVPPQEGRSWSGIMLPGAANSGFVTSHNYVVEPCNKKMTVTLTTDAADPILRMYFPDGRTQDIDNNFVGGETFVYEPAGGVPPGDYNAQLRPYAAVVANYTLKVTFE